MHRIAFLLLIGCGGSVDVDSIAGTLHDLTVADPLPDGAVTGLCDSTGTYTLGGTDAAGTLTMADCSGIWEIALDTASSPLALTIVDGNPRTVELTGRVSYDDESEGDRGDCDVDVAITSTTTDDGTLYGGTAWRSSGTICGETVTYGCQAGNLIGCDD